MPEKDNILINGFLESCKRGPHLPALEIGRELYSYEELAGQAAGIANAINRSSAVNSGRTGILAVRSLTAYAGILGTLLSSRAYMPLNPRFPAGRNMYMLQKAGCDSLIIGNECLSEADTLLQHLDKGMHLIFPGINKEELKLDLPPGSLVTGKEELTDRSVPKITTSPADMAYLMFTSGTTGKPKGVPVSNANVCAYLGFISRKYDFNSEDRFSQTFDLTFDLSVHDLFVCWQSGACLCIPENPQNFSLPRYIRDKKLTVWFSVPSVALMLSRLRLLKEEYLGSLRISLFCGEPLLAETAMAWQKAAVNSGMVNLYGPTEATIAVSCYEWKKDDPDGNKIMNDIVSIGKIFNTQYFKILDSSGNEMPAGSPGLLHLRGSQVVSSYFGDEAATENNFIRKDKETWYNTGDIVTRDDDGDLFFLGREDQEIKISGYRVNLLEVEAVLRSMLENAQVAVVPGMDKDGEINMLVGFIEKKEPLKEQQELHAACQKYLPWYMIPKKYIYVERFPMTVNGKIDRKKLYKWL